MPTPDTEDKLRGLFQAVKDGTVTITDAMQAIRDAVEVIEQSAFSAGHREGEKYGRLKSTESAIYIP